MQRRQPLQAGAAGALHPDTPWAQPVSSTPMILRASDLRIDAEVRERAYRMLRPGLLRYPPATSLVERLTALCQAW